MKQKLTYVFLILFGVLLGANLLQLAEVRAGDNPNAVSAVLRARMIELVDDKGQARAQLQVEADGVAVFRMRDAKGAIRVKVDASEEGAGLLLLDERTEPAVHMLAKRNTTTVTITQKGKVARVLTP